MPENGLSPRAALNPTALSVQDAARLLTAVGRQPVSEAMLDLDIAEGAPTNADGTLNLVVVAVPPARASMHVDVRRGEPPWESGIKNGLRTSRPAG